MVVELKLARQLARLTQRQLADRSGVDVATISRLERSTRSYGQVAYSSIVRIARDGLGIAPEILFPVEQVGLGDTETRAAAEPVSSAAR